MKPWYEDATKVQIFKHCVLKGSNAPHLLPLLAQLDEIRALPEVASC